MCILAIVSLEAAIPIARDDNWVNAELLNTLQDVGAGHTVQWVGPPAFGSLRLQLGGGRAPCVHSNCACKPRCTGSTFDGVRGSSPGNVFMIKELAGKLSVIRIQTLLPKEKQNWPLQPAAPLPAIHTLVQVRLKWTPSASVDY